MAQKTKLFTQDLKLETNFFFDFILFFNIAVEKFGKKQFGQVRAPKGDFSKPGISQFQVQIL